MATLPDMTAHWESTLTQISEKQYRYQDFMVPLSETLTGLINQARQNRNVRAFRDLPPPPQAKKAGAKGKGKTAAKGKGKTGGKKRRHRKKNKKMSRIAGHFLSAG